MLPSKYLSLPRQEKAFIIAAIQMKIEADKQQAKETERKGKRGSVRRRR